MSLAAEKLFYTLAGFVLLTALFVLRSPDRVEVANLQNQMVQQFSVAWQQTIGDQPYFDDLALVLDSIHGFYMQAGDASLALLQHGAADHDLAQISSQTYEILVQSFRNLGQTEGQTLAASNFSETFMSEPPIYNIIPVSNIAVGAVSGASINSAVNDQTPWVTVRDNFTGQLYCLAVYNNNVNKYLGPCKNDYH